jgi:hypothetical protein
MLKTSRITLLVLLIAIFAGFYRSALVFNDGFPPGADIGLHNSIIQSITQGGNTNFLYNYYHMGGGSSITFPGFDIFVSGVMLFTGLPDYLAQAFVAILFSSLLVLVSFLITRKILNEPIALIVAFIAGVSYYDIYMLLWSGYANIVTLALIPITFYLLLEKSRFQRLPRLAAASLLSAAILLTHSLSTEMFLVILIVTVLIAFCIPSRQGINRKEALEWLIPPVIGGVIVSPFLLQAAPFYLNLNAPVYTGGWPALQQMLLPMRLVPIQYILPFVACFFLYILFFKYLGIKLLQLSTILLGVWLIITTALTQSYVLGFYTDYERFLYFAALPLIITIATGIYIATRLIAQKANQLMGTLHGFSKNRFLSRIKCCLLNRVTITLIAVVLILAVCFEVPHLTMAPSDGFQMQDQQQVMTQLGYDAMQWIKNNTPTGSVFVADALYGWWLGGDQRPTVSAVEPIFLTNAREYQPALLATRLLDTDYLIDNGLIQIREDGGYTANSNPEFLAKLTNSYYPLSFINFSSSQTTVTYSKNGEVATLSLSELPVIDMHIENSSSAASISIIRGNQYVTFTQTETVYSGLCLVNMTQSLRSVDPSVNLVSFDASVQTRGQIIQSNGSCIELKDSYSDVVGQLIFTGTQPALTQGMGNHIDLKFGLSSKSAELNYYVSVFEDTGSNTAETRLNDLLLDNSTAGYAEKAMQPAIDVFDYRQAILDLNASYVAVRDTSQLSRFTNDPLFRQVFVNDEAAIFKINR